MSTIDPATIRIDQTSFSDQKCESEVIVTEQISSPQPAPSTDAVITVVRDPHNNLGKKFALNPDGSISKESSVSVSFGIAKMHHVDNHDGLANLLKSIGTDPHAAIINASFTGIKIGEEFIILSGREIESRLGIPRSDREKQNGVHEISYDDKIYKAVGRFKENVQPSCWQYFDRDIDKHTPERFATKPFEDWKEALAGIVPGLADLSYCRVGSTSARVYHNGNPVGSGNGHVWFKMKDPDDIERFRVALSIRAAEGELTWRKPRYSRKESGTIVGQSLTTIIDPSVLTLGRLTFIGQPVVSEGLTVEPISASIHKGESDTLDTSLVTLPDAESIRKITRKAGVEMDVKEGSNGLRITANDLTLDTEIETEDHVVKTVREIAERGIKGKIRCQAPFRDSSSYAAFLSSGSDEKPFVYDSGTSITHWLNDFEVDELKLIQASGVANGLLDNVKADCGAPFEPEVLKALAVIEQQKPADYHRIRTELKKINKDVSVAKLDTAVKSVASKSITAQTHHGFASDVISRLTVDGHTPVGHEGSLYVVDPTDNLWVKYSSEKLVRVVAQSHDGKDNCKRSNEYSGIAAHAIMLASNDDFFADAPIGLATPDGFYRIKDNTIVVEPLKPTHRQRVKINVTPKQGDTLLFDAFMRQTFQSSVPGEEDQQMTLVQEVVGAIMTGAMAKYQKAVQFYDPYGRAGKGTLERIIRELVPPSFVTAVSPFNWGSEYYLASLAGARLNVVGELQDSKPIPAAAFKTVIGGDLLSGRHPTHRPISFKNEAAHLFMSNHLINTTDHSEAFFIRWLILEFPNSRLRSGLPIDPDLAERIIENELPGIAYWALEGAKRLMSNGAFSKSIVHDRLMEKWRRNASSLEEFIHECCELVSGSVMRKSDFYEGYRVWCGDSGRKPFSKSKVKELLAHNIVLGIVLTSLDGYEIFRGIRLKDEARNGSAHDKYNIVNHLTTSTVEPVAAGKGATGSDGSDLY